MYTTPSMHSNRINYHDQIVTKAKNFKNTLKITNTTDINNRILLEISYIKNNGIRLKNIFVKESNLNDTVKKFKLNNFEIISDNKDDSISKFNTIQTPHPEYTDNSHLNEFKRQGYNNSFIQKYIPLSSNTTTIETKFKSIV